MTKTALPDTTACPAPVADIATCYSAKHASGAYLLAAMPKNWNGHLIVFAHGGPHIVPPTATTSQTDLAKYSIGVRQGFAWVASTFRREGYGVRSAAEDSEHARQFFVDRIARPRRTIFHGASWGGLVGSNLVEIYAKGADGSTNYDGAFFNSGFVAGAPLGYEFRADLRVVYQYYCKNLPRPDEPQYPLMSGIAGGYYHVTCRGNDRRTIYRDDRDRTVFLDKLRGSLANYQVECHAYVLMSNHFHLLVSTPKGNLSEFMRHGITLRGSHAALHAFRLRRIAVAAGRAGQSDPRTAARPRRGRAFLKSCPAPIRCRLGEVKEQGSVVGRASRRLNKHAVQVDAHKRATPRVNEIWPARCKWRASFM